ncbi:hypothetical protein L1077_22160 [Pseudoalteromonas luteoviolacea]|uniref:hypothetical protein n=1 Tax=Pseudoalteromonas luteoviolacea TaxID=43657 RepID=UPI001F1B325F|nr:hypothetical protein [Pseudoalteromonas luteoviolacea]MCF6442135.1 hypothetical protein [Pseudoalteromonas luteoviolacea]
MKGALPSILVLFLEACMPSNVYDAPKTMDLIAKTEAAAPNSIYGVYRFKVKSAARRGSVVFLNTEDDYRDRRSVAIVLDLEEIKQLTELHGQSPEVFFLNKQVEVVGEAYRAKVNLYCLPGVKPTQYYYQTRISVQHYDFIKVINEIGEVT